MILTLIYSFFFFFYCYGDHRDLHSSLHDALPISAGFTLPTKRAESASVKRTSSSRLRWRRCSGRCTSTSRSSTPRSEEHTSELQSRENLVCRLLLEKKNNKH